MASRSFVLLSLLRYGVSKLRAIKSSKSSNMANTEHKFYLYSVLLEHGKLCRDLDKLQDTCSHDVSVCYSVNCNLPRCQLKERYSDSTSSAFYWTSATTHKQLITSVILRRTLLVVILIWSYAQQLLAVPYLVAFKFDRI